MQKPITDLKEGEKATIIAFEGGQGFLHKLRTMGIMEGKEIKLIAVHPFGGPIVIEINNRETTLGRGMAQKIIVEV